MVRLVQKATATVVGVAATVNINDDNNNFELAWFP